MSRTILKSYFETGDVPTEAQFAAFIDEALNIPDDIFPQIYHVDPISGVDTNNGKSAAVKTLQKAIDLREADVSTYGWIKIVREGNVGNGSLAANMSAYTIIETVEGTVIPQLTITNTIAKIRGTGVVSSLVLASSGGDYPTVLIDEIFVSAVTLNNSGAGQMSLFGYNYARITMSLADAATHSIDLRALSGSIINISSAGTTTIDQLIADENGKIQLTSGNLVISDTHNTNGIIWLDSGTTITTGTLTDKLGRYHNFDLITVTTKTTNNYDVASNLNIAGQAKGGAGTVTFSATASFDMDDGNIQKMVMTGNITSLALTNKVNGSSYRIILEQGGSGSYTIATPGASFGTVTDNAVASGDFPTSVGSKVIYDITVEPDGDTFYSVEILTV